LFLTYAKDVCCSGGGGKGESVGMAEGLYTDIKETCHSNALLVLGLPQKKASRIDPSKVAIIRIVTAKLEKYSSVIDIAFPSEIEKYCSIRTTIILRRITVKVA